MAERRRGRRPFSIARAAGAALARIVRGGVDFARRVYQKAGEDDVFFLAGGISFNILLGALPFLLLLISIFGFVLQRAVDDPRAVAVEYVVSILPRSRRVVAVTERLVAAVVENRAGTGILGLALFVWAASRLFGSLRSVLKHIFDLPETRGVIAGKLFDLRMVVVSGTLFLLNTGITVAVQAAQTYGVEWLGIAGRPETQAAQRALAQLLAFGFIFLMFVLIYRYVPARRTPWRISLVAATFTSVAWELLKGLFAWYIANVASYTTTYGALVAPVILVFWIYYSAVVFVLGGEVAQVYDLLRTRRRQRELLE